MWDEGTVRWQTTQYSYNAQGLVGERRERVLESSQTPWDLFTYTYNRAGMLTQDRVTVGSNILRHQYHYDRRGLLTTVGVSHFATGSFSQILALDYAIDGAVTERRLGTGMGQTAVPYAYDVAGRIYEIGDVAQSGQPFAAKYSYTPSGLISRIDTRSGAAAQSCPYSADVCVDYWRYTFSYDALARLTGAVYRPVVNPTRDVGYTVSNISYDRQGNLLTLRRYAPTTSSPDGIMVDQLTYTYTARTNRLQSVADAVTTDLDWDAKPSEFYYNRVGSMTQMTETLPGSISRTTSVQRYDERQLPEHLTITRTQGQSILSVQQVHYRYDVNGQRISKDIPTGAHAGYERYVRDGVRLIGVFDENNTLKNWNLGGAAGLVGRADHNPMIFPPEHRYYVTDHLGSIRAVVNHSGTVIEGRDYYPYGLTMPGRFYVLSDTTREGFTGHELDKETGDYYAGARFYGPAIARWMVVDPMADAYPGWSPYNYTLGNPVMFIDPDGMEPGDFFDDRGNYLGTDGIDDGRVYIVTDSNEAIAIRSTNMVGGTTSASSVSSAIEIPGNSALGESLHVLKRTMANGGLSEESSLVMNDGSILRGATGDPMQAGTEPVGATLPALPSGKSENDVVASIHSHPTGAIFSDGSLYSASIHALGPNDPGTFSQFSDNMVVGRSGPSTAYIDQNGTLIHIDRPSLATAFYNRSSSHMITLPVPSTIRILNHLNR